MTDPITRLNAALEGRYRVERGIGEGGMAVVYLAEDLRHERKVALKVLKPELAAVVGAERFLAEIKTTANLQHPHILPLHDSGEADGFKVSSSSRPTSRAILSATRSTVRSNSASKRRSRSQRMSPQRWTTHTSTESYIGTLSRATSF